MNQLYVWCIGGLTALVAANTLWRLWTERDRLTKEDLSDDDRAFVWRAVVFLIYPLFTLFSLRATILSLEWLGGYAKHWTYGLLWYDVTPAGLPQNLVIPALFSGPLAAASLALLLIPALFFRPHPFLATLVGYTVSFVLAVTCMVDPILSIAGLGSTRWHLAFVEGAPEQRSTLLAVHVTFALLYCLMLKNGRVRLWFSELTRPDASDELRSALCSWHASPESARLACRVGLLYDRSGLRSLAKRQLRKLKSDYSHSLYSYFLEAVLSYRRRDYKHARNTFIFTSDFPGVDGELKGNLLAAAACAAFADGDIIGALNLSERALEFDDACLVARMVKVDVFLRQGKRDQAGEEILLAMHLGLTLDLENKIPLDVDRSYKYLVELEEARAGRQAVHTSVRR